MNYLNLVKVKFFYCDILTPLVWNNTMSQRKRSQPILLQNVIQFNKLSKLTIKHDTVNKSRRIVSWSGEEGRLSWWDYGTLLGALSGGAIRCSPITSPSSRTDWLYRAAHLPLTPFNVFTTNTYSIPYVGTFSCLVESSGFISISFFSYHSHISL